MQKLRILVADDNPLSLRFLADALAGMGHEIVEAEDGGVALARADESACDVLLFDARMPNLGGAQALALIRTQAGLSQHAIALATTADNDRATHATLRAAGFVDVLVKPLDVNTLRSAIAQQVPGFGVGDESFDDSQALAAAGGDAAIVTALRGLFAIELESLPSELARFCERQDATAVRERLHRLDASAGFCGVPALVRAAATLRSALDRSAWPSIALVQFHAACERTRILLTR
ncbi:MAG: response regulator [Dokdonella sp.]